MDATATTKDSCHSERDTLVEQGRRYTAAAAATQKVRFDKMTLTTTEDMILAQVAFLDSYLQLNLEDAKLHVVANEFMLCVAMNDLHPFEGLGKARSEHAR